MRIAYLCADRGVPVFGTKGASVHVQSLVAALLRRGDDVELFAARRGGEPPHALRDVPVHPLPRPAGEPAACERAALAANRELALSLTARGPFDLVYERYSLWSYAGMEHATGPAVLELNAPLIDEQAEHRTLVHRSAAERVARRAFAAATAIVAVSSPLAGWAVARGVPRARVRVIPNGVDPERWPSARRLAHDGFTVGFIGTLKPWHGLDLLVDAFGRLHRRRPQARLLVVGDGPGRAFLERALAERGLSGAARLAGAVAPEAVPALAARMDAGVAPYPDREPFYFSPLKVVEYMAAGLPVVASRVGQVAETVEHGVTGLLCPPGDPQLLALALERLVDDPELAARLGAAGRSVALRRHSWDAVAARILEAAQPAAAVAA